MVELYLQPNGATYCLSELNIVLCAVPTTLLYALTPVEDKFLHIFLGAYMHYCLRSWFANIIY